MHPLWKLPQHVNTVSFIIVTKPVLHLKFKTVYCPTHPHPDPHPVEMKMWLNATSMRQGGGLILFLPMKQ